MVYAALLPLLGLGLVGQVAALYEDQKGLNDWYQAYVGNVIESCFSEEKRHFAVATESNVVGAIGLKGDVVWRHVYAPEDKLDDAACHGGVMVVASSGGHHVRAFDIHTGDLLWDKVLDKPDNSGRAGLALSADGSVVAVVGGKSLSVMPSARPGDSVRRLEGMPQDVSSVQFNGEKVYVVGSTGGSTHAVVVDLKTMAQVGAATIGSTGTFAAESLVYVADGKLFASDLAASPKITDKSIESLLGSSSKDAHVVPVGAGAASGLVGVSSQEASALVAVKANGDISLIKKWKDPSAFGSTAAKGSVVVARVAVSTGVASEVLVLENGSIVTSEANVIALPPKAVHGAAVNVFPVVKVTDKSSGKLGHRVLVTTTDHGLILVAGSKHVFTREEGLASIAHARFVDLPSDQSEVALLMEEFKSAGDAENLLGNAIDRWSTQAVQFQRWVTSLIQDGVRLFASSDADGEEKLTADTFGLRKVVVAVSKAGKAYGLFSSNGKIIWSTMLAGSMGAFTPTANPIMLARSAAHYPHPPRAIVLGSNEAGQCVLYSLNPINGDATRQATHYRLLQAMLVPGMDSTGASPVLLVDTDQNVHVVHVGDNADEVMDKRMGTLHVFTVHEADGRLQGYHIARVDGKLVAQSTWKVVFPTETETIVTIAYKQPYEPIKLQFSVVDEKNTILYKYLNPNLLVVFTLSTDGLLSLYLVDTVTGGILHRASHTHAGRPVNAIQFENTVLYQFFDSDLKRYQVVVNDLFESGRHEDRIPFESSQAAAPVVARQAYVFQHPVTALGVTITQQNIAYRQILMGLGNGALYALDRKFVDTRRPNKKESTLQDVPPYQPVLPYTPQQILNYYQTLHNINAIVAAPTHLESHGLVLSYGLELFCTRVIPSGSFDLLNEDFNKPVLLITVLGMMVASVVTGYLAKEKSLKLQWK